MTAQYTEWETRTYAAARSEQTVVWYTGLLVEDVVLPIRDGFMRRYPGIELIYDRDHPIDSAGKIIEEARRGIFRADVCDGAGSPAMLGAAGDLAIEFRPPACERVPDHLRDPDARWTAQIVYHTTLGYNGSVAREDVPTTFEGLLDPRWKNRMGWALTTLSGRPGFVGNALLSLGHERGMAYLVQLRGQNVRSVNGLGRHAMRALGDGEFSLGLQVFAHHVAIENEVDNRVGFVAFEPMLSFPNPLSLLRQAPHPNAGRLLINFIVSEHGQEHMRQGRHIPVQSDVMPLDPDLHRSFRTNFLAPAEVCERYAQWTLIGEAIFDT